MTNLKATTVQLHVGASPLPVFRQDRQHHQGPRIPVHLRSLLHQSLGSSYSCFGPVVSTIRSDAEEDCPPTHGLRLSSPFAKTNPVAILRISTNINKSDQN